MYNKANLVNNITRSISFMKNLGYINLNIIDYDTVNQLKPANYVLNYVYKQYKTNFVQYILLQILKQIS